MKFLFAVLIGVAGFAQQIPLDTFPMSTALSPDGRFLLILHAGINRPSVQVLNAKTFEKLGRAEFNDAWLGLTFAPNGKSIYVGGGSTASVHELTLGDDGQLRPARTFETVPAPQRQPQDFIGDVALSPDGRLLYAASLYRDRIVVINPLTGTVIERIPTARRPYRILFHPDGKSFFVSSWADSAVVQHKAETGERLNVLRTGPHPTDMIWRTKPPQLEEGEEVGWKSRLFIAAANTNNVYIFGFKEDGTSMPIGTISVSLTPQQPAGMTPSAFALSADQNTLYTVCSDGNSLAVTDVTGTKPLRIGYIPVGEYPTAVRVLPDGRIFTTNGSGSATVSVEPPIDLETALKNSPYRDAQLLMPEGKSAIQQVIYVIGDTKIGINHQKLAKEFVQLSSFHANGSTVTDRVNWAGAAITVDFVRKLSPGSAAGRAKLNASESEPAARPPAGYLWTNAAAKEVAARLKVVALKNDVELGELVETASKSPAWKATAIFVLNAADGSALLISPYTRGRGVDSNEYDTSSMLRTIELILGLSPMTQFDAAAVPMTASFGTTPDPTPYTAVR